MPEVWIIEISSNGESAPYHECGLFESEYEAQAYIRAEFFGLEGLKAVRYVRAQ